jgi:hypothetical protein
MSSVLLICVTKSNNNKKNEFDKLNFLKIKSFCTSKDIMKKRGQRTWLK